MEHDYELLNQLPGLTSIKDENSRFITISTDLAALLGWKTVEQSIDKTDYDLPCPAAEFAENFIAMDNRAFKSDEKLILLDVQNYAVSQKIILSERRVYNRESRKIIICQGVDLTDVAIYKNYFILSNEDKKHINGSVTSRSYILSDYHSPLDITDKQACCLFYLIRGKSFKSIAKKLNISPRTVESHIEAIKRRFCCYTKDQIIECALDKGFLFFIPLGLQNNI